MNKENFIRHMEVVAKANETYDNICNAIGCGDMVNGFTNLVDDIPDIYADVFEVNASDTYYDAFWSLMLKEEYNYNNTCINNWDDFYDYFFVKND